LHPLGCVALAKIINCDKILQSENVFSTGPYCVHKAGVHYREIYGRANIILVYRSTSTGIPRNCCQNGDVASRSPLPVPGTSTVVVLHIIFLISNFAFVGM
jgi:hypothetical protein